MAISNTSVVGNSGGSINSTTDSAGSSPSPVGHSSSNSGSIGIGSSNSSNSGSNSGSRRSSAALSPMLRSQRQGQQEQVRLLDHRPNPHQQHIFIASHRLSPPCPPPPFILLHTCSPSLPSSSSSSFSSSSSSWLISPTSPTSSSPLKTCITLAPSPTSSPTVSPAPAPATPAVGSLSPRPASVLSQPSPTIPHSPPATFSSHSPDSSHSPRTATSTAKSSSNHNDRPSESPTFSRQPRSNHHSPTRPKRQLSHPRLQGLGLVIEDPSKKHISGHSHQHQNHSPPRLALKHLPRAHIDPQTSLPSPPSSGHIRYPLAAPSGSQVNEPSSPHSPCAKKANHSPPIRPPPTIPGSSTTTTGISSSSSFSDQYTLHTSLPRPSNMAPPPSTASVPHFPTRQESQHYRTHTHFQTPLNVSYHHHPQQQQQPSAPASPPPMPSAQHGNISREDYEEIEDRRRMQQQILRDKLLYAETHAPDPAMTVKTTTNHGFALGAFDMSESLAIVEDLLDYFGENEQALLDGLDGADQFNQAELMEAERVHLQRESLIRHLYDSEEDYIRSLTDMSRFYRQPMLLLVQQAEHRKGTLSFGSGSAPKPIASKEEIQTLFGNLDELIRFHEGFRDALESRAKIWGPNQIISDLLMEVIPNFKVYTKYYTNFHAALTTLDRIMRLPHYKKFQEQCVIDNPPGTPSLHLMLASPLRRISMTREILGSICQVTQPNHPDYRKLMGAYELFCQVSEQTRVDRLHAQDQLALFDIQSSMVAFHEPIMIPNRRLVLRADLHKVDSSLALEPRTYYLMNDVLLYARFDPKKNIYTYKGMFDLLFTQVNNPEDNATLPQLPNCIQIANAGRKQMIRCRSREEKQYWMETLKQAVEVVNNSTDDPSAPLGDVLPLRKYATSIASDSTTSLATFAGQSSVVGGGASHGQDNDGPSSSLAPPTGITSGPIAPSVAGGITNNSMKSHAISSFTNMTKSTAGMDNQSLTSKASSTDSQGKPKIRRYNPQADFYGCSFGVSFDVNLNEDNVPATRSLGSVLQGENNASTASVTTISSNGSTNGSSIMQAGMRTQQPLGAMLASIPEDKLTAKQRKAKEALAKAVEARRQARLKEEAKKGKAVTSSAASTHSNGSNSGPQKDDATTRQVNPDFSSAFIPVRVRRDVVGK